MKYLHCASVAFLLLASENVSAEAPTLPENATKLGGEEIVKLYHGMKATYENHSNKTPLTGTAFYDFDKKRIWGFYNSDNKDRGLFKGTGRIKGDKFCHKTGGAKETCVTVHKAGDQVYEVDEKGKVLSRNVVSSAAATDVPAGAVKATPDTFKELVDGKTVSVTIFDAGAPLVARLKWDFTKLSVRGKFIYDGKQAGNANTKISIDADKICTKAPGEKPACHAIVVDDRTFYEVTDAGAIHAVSVIE